MSRSPHPIGSPTPEPTGHRPDGQATPDSFAARLGMRVSVERGAPDGCWATATLPAPPPPATGTVPTGAVPTGALLALVDATARAAADAALAGPGVRVTLVPAAASVQYRAAAAGSVTARASVPCEGTLADRADEHGLLRFSVAVDVVDGSGTPVASGSVQWRATVVADPPGDAAGPPAGGE